MKMAVKSLARCDFPNFFRIFRKVVRHILLSPNTNLTPQGHTLPPVLQGSNLEMVDRGVLDQVPDVLQT